LSERLFWLMSLLIAASMVISLFIVALPGPVVPTPTPFPTLTPLPRPTDTPLALPEESSATASPLPLPTQTATEPAIGPSLPTETATEPAVGPALPTETPAEEPTESATPLPTFTVTPSVTVTPTQPSAALTFAVCGDSHSDPETYRQVLAAIAGDDVEFLVHTGDLVNKGTESQWQVFKSAMEGFDLPFYPVPGNHDGLDGKLGGYLAHSGAPARHYAFDRGPVHLTFADSHNGGIGAAELAWLREDLSATSLPIKMVVLHHPPFDPDGSDYIMAYGRRPFMDLMVEQEVDYVFAGHIHAYVRGERDGVDYVITGGAGAPLYGGEHPQAFHHYLRVTVRGGEVEIEVVRI
jgi:predicted phosphodiesterase